MCFLMHLLKNKFKSKVLCLLFYFFDTDHSLMKEYTKMCPWFYLDLNITN